MTGNEESFEFKSFYDLDEKDFVSGLNRNVPPGILFLGLKIIEAGAPSLTERIAAMVYALDLNAEDIKKALDRWREEKQWTGNDAEIAAILVRDYLTAKPELVKEITIDRASNRVIIHIAFTPQKLLRPQDIVKHIFGLEHAVYIMSREKIFYK
jgi:hypothetical protein